MTIDEFLIDDVSSKAYDEPNFVFWIRTVIDAMALLGPKADSDLKRLTQRLLDYCNGAGIGAEFIDGQSGINREIGRIGATSWKNQTPLSAKYRALRAIAFSREANLADPVDWQDGVVIAFQTINLYSDNDEGLIDLIRQDAAKYSVDLYANSTA